MAKKKEAEAVDAAGELIPVLLPNGCISHWVPKAKD